MPPVVEIRLGDASFRRPCTSAFLKKCAFVADPDAENATWDLTAVLPKTVTLDHVRWIVKCLTLSDGEILGWALSPPEGNQDIRFYAAMLLVADYSVDESARGFLDTVLTYTLDHLAEWVAKNICKLHPVVRRAVNHPAYTARLLAKVAYRIKYNVRRAHEYFDRDSVLCALREWTIDEPLLSKARHAVLGEHHVHSTLMLMGFAVAVEKMRGVHLLHQEKEGSFLNIYSLDVEDLKEAEDMEVAHVRHTYARQRANALRIHSKVPQWGPPEQCPPSCFPLPAWYLNAKVKGDYPVELHYYPGKVSGLFGFKFKASKMYWSGAGPAFLPFKTGFKEVAGPKRSREEFCALAEEVKKRKTA